MTGDAWTRVERVSASVAAGRCFGGPIEHQGTTFVPVALVIGGGGAGGSSNGDGGGFGFWATPLGIYVLRDGHARFRPAVRPVHVIAGVAVGVWLVRHVRRVRRAVARDGASASPNPDEQREFLS